VVRSERYPELKRAVRDQAWALGPRTILVADKAAGTELIQELVNERQFSHKLRILLAGLSLLIP
jgi:hypothetical protein